MTPAPANMPAPLPACLASAVISALARAISLRAMLDMSLVASATSWPSVRSGVVFGVVVIGALTSGDLPGLPDLPAGQVAGTPDPTDSRAVTRATRAPRAWPTGRSVLHRFVLEAVRDPVAVVVALLLERDLAVDAVAQPQDDGGQGRRGDRPDEDGHLDVLVTRGARPVGEAADQERHGEPDAGQEREAQDVGPAEVVVELGAGEPGEPPGAAHHPDRLADHEREHDPERGRVGECRTQA